jgi:hypothetical protein
LRPGIGHIGEDGVVDSRIMHIKCKDGALTGDARIGRVRFSKTRRTLYYGDQQLRRLPYGGFKANYYDVATGADYWVSGPKRDGGDRLYGERVPVHVDEDVREEYWISVRGRPDRVGDFDASR